MNDTLEQQAQKTWQMLQNLIMQNENLNKEFDQRLEKTNKTLSEQIKETDRILSEKFQETDRILSERKLETDRILTKTSKETEKKFQETYNLIKESSRKADKYLGKINEFDRNWGKLVESLVAPSIVKQFKKTDIEIEGMNQRVMRRKEGNTLEIDILLTNSHIIIPIEVKTTLNVDSVNEHIEKHLIPFKHFFPEYKDKTIYGAVAYIHVEENADRYAYKKGLYVLTFGNNDIVVIKNDSQFKPTSF